MLSSYLPIYSQNVHHAVINYESAAKSIYNTFVKLVRIDQQNTSIPADLGWEAMKNHCESNVVAFKLAGQANLMVGCDVIVS